LELKEILAKGITGYCDFDATDFHFINYKLFKSKCYELASKINGKVLYIDDDNHTINRNFRIARINGPSMSIEEKCFEVLINLHYPIIGLVKGRESEKFDACFIDLEEVKVFFQDNYLVLSKEKLDEDFNYTSDELNQMLYKHEIEQIRYWKPQKLSEVLFNYWD
jgi:hypothetical protein